MVPSRVDAGTRDLDLLAALVIEALGEEGIQLAPGLIPSRVSMDLGPGNEPRLLGGPETVHSHLQAVSMHIDSGNEDSNAGRDLGRVVLCAGQDVIGLHAVATFLPGLPEHGVDPGLEAERVLLRIQKLLDALPPGLPAKWAVETREMEAHRAPISLRGGTPRPALQHLGLVPLVDHPATALAKERGGL